MRKDEINGKAKEKLEEETKRLERVLLDSAIEVRKEAKLAQHDLRRKTGISQPVISRMETGEYSPHLNTLIKVLYVMGYTLEIVPVDKTQKK